MVQGLYAHLQLHETSTVVLDRLNIITDRLNVINSGGVHPSVPLRGVSYHHVTQMQKYETIWRQYFKSDQVEVW
jgi:hypothetical protein